MTAALPIFPATHRNNTPVSGAKIPPHHMTASVPYRARAGAPSPKNDRSRFLNGTRCGVPATGGTFSQTEGTKTMNEKVQRIMGPVLDRRTAAGVSLWVLCAAWLAAGVAVGSALMAWVLR